MVGSCMEKIKGRLINLPPILWDNLEVDAGRCKRSVTKQIEAILDAYFEIENVNLNNEPIKQAQSKNNFNPADQQNKPAQQTANGSTAPPDKVEIVGKPLDAPYLNELGFDETSFADLEENKSAAAVRKKKNG